MKIEENILKILSECTIKDNAVFLPDTQLDRKTYIAVNKHLENLGGKWNRKMKGHVFSSDPNESFENMLLTGETTDFKKEFQFFETPPELARKMVKMAELTYNNERILEPSAGHGKILDALYYHINTNSIESSVDVIEINKYNCTVLEEKGHSPIQMDFLMVVKEEVGGYDKIVMNPPFTKQQDIDHITHAWSMLADGGILVSVVSESPFFRENNKSVEFRKWLDIVNAKIIINPEGTFKPSGTMVNTRLIKIVK